VIVKFDDSRVSRTGAAFTELTDGTGAVEVVYTDAIAATVFPSALVVSNKGMVESVKDGSDDILRHLQAGVAD